MTRAEAMQHLRELAGRAADCGMEQPVIYLGQTLFLVLQMDEFLEIPLRCRFGVADYSLNLRSRLEAR